LTREETKFWEVAARKGLPWFRFLRRSLTTEELDAHLNGSCLEGEWVALKSKMLPGDELWPFEFGFRRFWSGRRGYILLRNGKPVGGIVTESA
jgi:hypothetical protein